MTRFLPTDNAYLIKAFDYTVYLEETERLFLPLLDFSTKILKSSHVKQMFSIIIKNFYKYNEHFKYKSFSG